MRHLLRILKITNADIAHFAGLTRQAVHQGSNTVDSVSNVLIEAARLDAAKITLAEESYLELSEFLGKQLE